MKAQFEEQTDASDGVGATEVRHWKKCCFSRMTAAQHAYAM